MNRRQRRSREGGGEGSGESGILDERILRLVFEWMKWDPHVLCQAACVSRKLRAVAKRVLWKELCISRAPQMAGALMRGAPGGRMGGGWHALAKLFFFCCGCESSRHFRVGRPLPGHFVGASRFSKTSGKSFLVRKCWGDLLYVSDPCEHPMGANDDDIGVYRGVFSSFMKSRTRACLLRRQVELEPVGRCPYCGARVWNMTTARLVPRSASRRLGSHDGRLDYFVCINGHLFGHCWLARLSSEDDGVARLSSEDDGDDDSFDDVEHHNDNTLVSSQVGGTDWL